QVLCGIRGVAAAVAIGADDVDIGEKLHIEGDFTSTFTARADQRAGVIGEIRGAETIGTRSVGRGVVLAQLIHYSRIGGHGGADVVANGGGIDNLDFDVIRGVELTHM